MTFKNFDEYSIFIRKNSNFTGVCVVLYSNGRKWFEHNFVNGKYHGKQKVWFSNGQKDYEHNYVNDFRIGVQLYDGKIYETKPEENTIWYILVRETL